MHERRSIHGVHRGFLGLVIGDVYAARTRYVGLRDKAAFVDVDGKDCLCVLSRFGIASGCAACTTTASAFDLSHVVNGRLFEGRPYGRISLTKLSIRYRETELREFVLAQLERLDRAFSLLTTVDRIGLDVRVFDVHAGTSTDNVYRSLTSTRVAEIFFRWQTSRRSNDRRKRLRYSS